MISMRLSISKQTLSPIGVDFGTDCLKLLQVDLSQDAPRLVAAAAKAVPHEVRNDTEQRRKFLVDTIADLYREGGFKGKRAIASIPTPLSFIQHVRVSRVEGGRLEDAVRDALAERLPVDPSQLVMRCIDIGQVPADGTTKQEVICMAAARQAVMHHIEICKRAKLDVVGMHCEPNAIVEAFAHLYRRAGDESKTTFFVDIGSLTTKAVIAHGRQMAFAKTIQVGSEHFDRQYARELQIELQEARVRRRRMAGMALPEAKPAAKRAVQPAPTGNGGGIATEGGRQPTQFASDAGQPHHESLAVGGEMLDCLIDELQLCAGYHGSVFRGRSIDKLVFIGGESKQTAMCQRVARTLKLPAQLGDPLARIGRSKTAKPPINVDFRQPQPAWAVPLGLCKLPSNL